MQAWKRADAGYRTLRCSRKRSSFRYAGQPSRFELRGIDPSRYCGELSRRFPRAFHQARVVSAEQISLTTAAVKRNAQACHPNVRDGRAVEVRVDRIGRVTLRLPDAVPSQIARFSYPPRCERAIRSPVAAWSQCKDLRIWPTFSVCYIDTSRLVPAHVFRQGGPTICGSPKCPSAARRPTLAYWRRLQVNDVCCVIGVGSRSS